MRDASLDAKLCAALASRDERRIRRRLPDPNTPSTFGLIDFNSNDYLSLSSSHILRNRYLTKLADAPDILGSGGSRLLVNGQAHSTLEARLSKFFGSEAALLFNSGFDANVGFFSCVPQPGDVIVYDEFIHASVHDGIRASRTRRAVSFTHNSVHSLRQILTQVLAQEDRSGLRTGTNSVFVAVESLYSMDGTFSPLSAIVHVLETLFPLGNAHLVVDEAHSTGVYGPQGRGRVAQLGLESKVMVRLHTFGKALAASGAVILSSTLIRDYLLNYARSLIYTTSLSFASVIAVDCSFDLLEDGTVHELATNLLDLSLHFTSFIRPKLASIPSDLLSLHHDLADPTSDHAVPPSPIIPLMTSLPRPLSAYLLALGMNARPITWPTVPKGKDRVRVCLHAANSKADVERLALGAIRWAEEVLAQQQVEEEERKRKLVVVPLSRQEKGKRMAEIISLQSKL